MSRVLLTVSVCVWAAVICACCFPDDKPAKQNDSPPREGPTKPSPAEPRSFPEPAAVQPKIAESGFELVDTTYLYQSYLANKAATDAKYQGKTVELEGTVHSVGRNSQDGPYAVFQSEPKGFVASAWFDRKLEKDVLTLKKGQSVRVRGKAAKSVVMKRDAEVQFSLDGCVLIGTPSPLEKAADPKAVEDQTPARKAAYVRIVAAIDQVDAAALKKFGRKPKADDLAGFTVPYKVFVEREMAKAFAALATELKLTRSDLDGIKAEGDAAAWPKK